MSPSIPPANWGRERAARRPHKWAGSQGRMIFTGLTPPYLLYRIAYYYYCSCCCCSSTSQLSGRMRSKSTLMERCFLHVPKVSCEENNRMNYEYVPTVCTVLYRVLRTSHPVWGTNSVFRGFYEKNDMCSFFLCVFYQLFNHTVIMTSRLQ